MNRVRQKAEDLIAFIFRAKGVDNELYKQTPEFIARAYKEVIIPLTKQIEVDYLMIRGTNQ